MSARPDVIVVTQTWDGLGLAMQMDRQGTNVLMAYDIADLEEKDRAAAEQCGEGLVDRMPLTKARKLYEGTGAIWLFDNNSFPKVADELRKAGERVLGTSVLSAKMEKDRDYGAGIAEEVGFDLSDTEEFSDVGKAVAYLEQHQDTAYVCKAQGGDADQTFVPQPSDAPAAANEELRGYLEALADHKDRPKKFILQERIRGVEVCVDLWVHEGKPLAAFVDLEAKRRLNGDLGELVGCAFDYLFQVPINSALVKRTAGRFLGRPELKGYTGSVDANVMLVGSKTYWLEACWRFGGYNSTPTLLYGLAKANTAAILEAWLDGKPLGGMFGRGYAASLTLFSGEHEADFPVLVPRPLLKSFCPYALKAGPAGLAMVGGGKAWYAVGCTVAGGATAEAAGKQALDIAGKICFPNKGHRTDLADDGLATLPLARLKKLRALVSTAGNPHKE